MRNYLKIIASFAAIASFALSGAELALPTDGPGDITVTHKGYTVSYDHETKEPAWVAWRLTPEMRAINRPRPSVSFRVDSACGSADPGNYAHSGHDIGHMCPSDDLEGDAEAMRDTFHTSNACPQLPGYNRGIWKELETETRDNSRTTELWVYRGPLHQPGEATIGADSLPVPAAFWAVAYAPSTGAAECYIIPHSTPPGGNLAPWKVGLERIEMETGLRFDNMKGVAK